MTAPGGTDVGPALAGIRAPEIEVELAGQTWTIPPAPAATWLEAVLSGEAFPIVPQMLDDGQEEELSDLMLIGEVSRADLVRANRDALEVASGMTWYSAERLIVSAAVQWRIVGGMLGRVGIDLERSPLSLVLSTIYVLAVENMAKEDRFRFDATLTALPAGSRAGEFDQADYQEAFAELMRAGAIH